MRRAVTSRKSAAEVEGQLKASSRKLEKLHWKLQELTARSMPTEKDAVSGREADWSPQTLQLTLPSTFDPPDLVCCRLH